MSGYSPKGATTVYVAIDEVLIIAVATWRLAYMLVREGGPTEGFTKFRAQHTVGGLLLCVKCTSFWVAALMLALWLTPLRPVVYIFAISGAGLMLASWSGVEFER